MSRGEHRDTVLGPLVLYPCVLLWLRFKFYEIGSKLASFIVTVDIILSLSLSQMVLHKKREEKKQGHIVGSNLTAFTVHPVKNICNQNMTGENNSRERVLCFLRCPIVKMEGLIIYRVSKVGWSPDPVCVCVYFV